VRVSPAHLRRAGGGGGQGECRRLGHRQGLQASARHAQRQLGASRCAAAAPPFDSGRAVDRPRRGALRAGDENFGSKRKSESSIDECDSKRAREDEEEGKQATTETSRDQLAEICAASAALKKVEEEARATFAKLTVPSLRSECTRLGLPTDGLKPALVARLVGHQAVRASPLPYRPPRPLPPPLPPHRPLA